MSELIGASADPSVPPGGELLADTAAGGRGVGLRRATVGMAIGTAVSRLTGVGRILALAYALGFTPLADAYNLANTTPNMLYDVVLGGVLSATFIPVFVERLTTRTERDAWRAISAVVTLALVVLVAASLLCFVAAPLIIAGLTALDKTHTTAGAVQLANERAVATTLLRYFAPQVALYGIISLVTALLNARQRFIAPMWVPIANNVVCIAVLLWFREVAGPHPSLAGAKLDPSQLLLLGVGTTLGVAVQALLVLPALRGARVGRLHWRLDPGHEAVRTVLRLGGWTFGFVLANQIALFIVLALAGSAPGPAPVTSYTYAYAFLQMPYAVVTVSIMSAVTPDLAEKWTLRDLGGFRHRLTSGMRAMLAIIIPASVGMLLLAKPAVALLLGHGAGRIGETEQTGAALALFSIGLPGFCIFLYVVRVLQAMQRTEVAFWLYLLENGLNLITAVALVHLMGVRGLALSLSLSYTVGAAAGLWLLRAWLGSLGDARTWAPLRRVALSTAVMGVVVLVVSNLSGASHGLGLLARVVGSIVAGVLAYAGTATLLARRRPRSRRPPPPPLPIPPRGRW